MNDKILKIQNELKKYLDKERYDHTLGVMYTAGSMAMRYGENLENTLIAGLLHDCAKCIPNEDKIQLCHQNNIPITDAELMNPGLLHAKLGAWLACNKYGITDESILHSIAYHTTGCPDMSLLDKIIYIADYIEPGRRELPNHPEVRKLAFTDIDACLLRILGDSLRYFESRNMVTDPMTEKAYLFYRDQLNM